MLLAFSVCQGLPCITCCTNSLERGRRLHRDNKNRESTSGVARCTRYTYVPRDSRRNLVLYNSSPSLASGQATKVPFGPKIDSLTFLDEVFFCTERHYWIVYKHCSSWAGSIATLGAWHCNGKEQRPAWHISVSETKRELFATRFNHPSVQCLNVPL